MQYYQDRIQYFNFNLQHRNFTTELFPSKFLQIHDRTALHYIFLLWFMIQGQGKDRVRSQTQLVNTIDPLVANTTEEKKNQELNKPSPAKNFIRERIKNLQSKLKAQRQKNQSLKIQKIEKVEQEQTDSKLRNKKFHKCQACKSTGKKIQMKLCHNCGHYTHISCCEEEIKPKTKFVCDKCSMESKKAHAIFSKKQQKIQESKITKLKIEDDKISKKKIKQKVLQKLIYQRPNLFNENSEIVYPIEDKFLFIYNEYFNIPQLKLAPSDHPLIPAEFLGKFLEIENFIVSYEKDIGLCLDGNDRKQILYSSMNCEGSDRLFEVLLGKITITYLKDIFNRSKILNEFVFFVLLKTLNQSHQLSFDFVVEVSSELIRNLMQISNMKKYFIGFEAPNKLTLAYKIDLLSKMIQGLTQIDVFHEMVGRKSERITEIIKERGDLIAEIKDLEINLISNKEKAKSKKKQAVKQTKDSLDMEATKSLISEHKDRVIKINKEIRFVISKVIYLGSDRNHSDYFFYLREPNRIYVKYSSFVLEESENFKIYETKQKIKEFAKSLSVKGVRQRRLQQSINKLIKDEIIINCGLEESKSNQQRLDSISKLGNCVFVQNDKKFREKIVHSIIQMEQKFSNFLQLKNYMWEIVQKREEFRKKFPNIENIGEMKQEIKKLQSNFVLPIKSQSNQSSDSKVEREMHELTVEKRKSLRFWGFSGDFRKCWTQYLESSVNFCGIWICVSTMNHYMNIYIEKKTEIIRQQQQKQLAKQQKNKKLTKLKQKQAETKMTKLRSKEQAKEFTRLRRSSRVESLAKTKKQGPELKKRKKSMSQQESSDESSIEEDEEYKINDDE